MSTPAKAPYKVLQRRAEASRRTGRYVYKNIGRPAQRYTKDGARAYRPWPRNLPMALK